MRIYVRVAEGRDFERKGKRWVVSRKVVRGSTYRSCSMGRGFTGTN